MISIGVLCMQALCARRASPMLRTYEESHIMCGLFLHNLCIILLKAESESFCSLFNYND